jgi:hypothetical protein
VTLAPICFSLFLPNLISSLYHTDTLLVICLLLLRFLLFTVHYVAGGRASSMWLARSRGVSEKSPHAARWKRTSAVMHHHDGEFRAPKTEPTGMHKNSWKMKANTMPMLGGTGCDEKWCVHCQQIAKFCHRDWKFASSRSM